VVPKQILIPTHFSLLQNQSFQTIQTLSPTPHLFGLINTLWYTFLNTLYSIFGTYQTNFFYPWKWVRTFFFGEFIDDFIWWHNVYTKYSHPFNLCVFLLCVFLSEECVMVSMEEGVFHYMSKGKSETCGLYLLTDPDKSIIVTVDYLDARCDQKGLISVSVLQIFCSST